MNLFKLINRLYQEYFKTFEEIVPVPSKITEQNPECTIIGYRGTKRRKIIYTQYTS